MVTTLAKSVLIPLELTAVASAADAGIYNSNFQLWNASLDNLK